MTRACGGRGYPECESCINKRHDPFQCDECVDGDRFESEEDEVDIMTIHQFRDWLDTEIV